MNPIKLTKTLKKIQFAIELKYGIYFDSVLINYYKDGSSGMRYHSDATYNKWHQESVVVSFGSSRKIIFREINNFDNKTNIIMNSGDLLFMKEGCQDIYQHRVTKDKSISDERISLVFKKHF
jgi:alkylated DNA repair dioxygenase AlkB